MKFTLYFDGGAKGNPGKGYGSWLIRNNENDIVDNQYKVQFGSNITNNQAEYLSLLGALEFLNINHYNELKDIDLLIYSDSLMLVNQINGQWKCKNYNLQVLLERCKSILSFFNTYKAKWHGRENNLDIFGH